MTDKIFSLKGKSYTFLLIFAWCLTFAVMAVIFSFSAQNSAASDEVSEGLLTRILQFLPFEISNRFLRKLAHFSEYALLGAVSFCAVSLTRRKPAYFSPLLFSALYAATDEIHQLFVPGRSGRAFDVLIDSSGAAAGIIFAVLLFAVIDLTVKKIGERC